MDYKLTDPKGLGLDRLGITTPGTISVSFLVTYIPKGQTQYVSYITRNRASTDGKNTVVQATGENTGVQTQVADGEYLYTFATKLPKTYDPTATHQIGIYGSRNLTEFDLGTNYDDAVYDFVPAGGTPAPRDVVKTASCNKCHDQLAFHGGSRRSMELCIMCHQPQTSEAQRRQDGGFQGDDPQDPHGQPAAEREGEDALRDRLHRLVHGGLPLRSAALRELPRTEERRGPGHAPGTRIRAGRPADPATTTSTSPPATNHVNLPQVDDTQCATCHIPKGELEFDASIQGAHVVPQESATRPGIVINLVKVDNGGAGQKPTITFTLKDSAGKPIDPSTLVDFAQQDLLRDGRTDHRLRLHQLRQRRHHARVRLRGGGRAQPSAGSDGTCTYTFTHAVPADAKGTFAIGVEARRALTILPGTVKQLSTQYGADNKVMYFSDGRHADRQTPPGGGYRQVQSVPHAPFDARREPQQHRVLRSLPQPEQPERCGAEGGHQSFGDGPQHSLRRQPGRRRRDLQDRQQRFLRRPLSGVQPDRASRRYHQLRDVPRQRVGSRFPDRHERRQGSGREDGSGAGDHGRLRRLPRHQVQHGPHGRADRSEVRRELRRLPCDGRASSRSARSTPASSSPVGHPLGDHFSSASALAERGLTIRFHWMPSPVCLTRPKGPSAQAEPVARRSLLRKNWVSVACFFQVSPASALIRKPSSVVIQPRFCAVEGDRSEPAGIRGRLGLPGGAAIPGAEKLSGETGDPAVVGVLEGDGTERPGGAGNLDGLPFPAAVGGVQDEAGPSGGPAVLGVEEVQGFERKGHAALLLRPGLAAIGGVEQDAIVAGDPAFVADHLNVGEVLGGAGLAFLPGAAGIGGDHDDAAFADGEAAVFIGEGERRAIRWRRESCAAPRWRLRCW